MRSEPQHNSGGIPEAIGGRRRRRAGALDGNVMPLVINLCGANRETVRDFYIETSTHRPEECGVTRNNSIWRCLTHPLSYPPEQSMREGTRTLPAKNVNRSELIGVAMYSCEPPSSPCKTAVTVVSAELRRQPQRFMEVAGYRGNPPVEIGGGADVVESASIVSPAPTRSPLQRIAPEQL